MAYTSELEKILVIRRHAIYVCMHIAILETLQFLITTYSKMLYPKEGEVF